MSESICLQCGHKRICAMGVNQPHENVTVTGCSRFEQKQQLTNADLYRAYSDEQIAELFNQIETEGKAYGPRGKKAWLDWLKQEAT